MVEVVSDSRICDEVSNVLLSSAISLPAIWINTFERPGFTNKVLPASKVFSVDSREYLWLSPEGRELSEPVYT